MGVVEVNWTVVGARKRRAQPIREAKRRKEAAAQVCPLVEHPEWIGLKEKILSALAPFAEARRAMERALASEHRPAGRDW